MERGTATVLFASVPSETTGLELQESVGRRRNQSTYPTREMFFERPSALPAISRTDFSVHFVVFLAEQSRREFRTVILCFQQRPVYWEVSRIIYLDPDKKYCPSSYLDVSDSV